MRMWDVLFGRQRQTETGGFQGRANKEADSCYAFWLVRIEPNCPKMLTECSHFLMHYVGVYDLLIIFFNSFMSYSAYASVHQVVFKFKASCSRI
jgi:hypothetical protein